MQKESTPFVLEDQKISGYWQAVQMDVSISLICKTPDEKWLKSTLTKILLVSLVLKGSVESFLLSRISIIPSGFFDLKL